MINWDNDLINDNLMPTIPIQTNTEKLISNPLGTSTLKTKIK